MKFKTIFYISLIAMNCGAAPQNHPRHPQRHPIPIHVHHSNHTAGFVGGLIGGLIGSQLIPRTVSTTTFVTPQHTVVQQPKIIWIEGHYEDRIVNGSVVKVWIPGYYVEVK